MPIIRRVPDFEGKGMSFIIENVFVDFASVFKPNTKYRPEWAVVIRVPQNMIQEFYEVGFRLRQDQNGMVTLRAKRYVRLDDGTEMEPPRVVDCDNNPWPEARGLIGNGSRCNVKVKAKYTEYQGVEGLSCYLEGLQVLDHIPYEGSGAQFGQAQGTTGGWDGNTGFEQNQQQSPLGGNQPQPGQFVPGQQQQPPIQPPVQPHQSPPGAFPGQFGQPQHDPTPFGGAPQGGGFQQPQQPAFQPEPSQMLGQQDMAFGQQQPPVNPAVPPHMQQPAPEQGQPYVPPGTAPQHGDNGGGFHTPGNPVDPGGQVPGGMGQPPASGFGQAPQGVPQGAPQGGNVSQAPPQASMAQPPQGQGALGGFGGGGHNPANPNGQQAGGLADPTTGLNTYTGDDVPF